MKAYRVRVLMAALGLLCAAGCGDVSSGTARPGGRTSPPGEAVTIFAAASTTNAIDQIKAAFTQETGTQVQASYAASSALAQQIANGAEPDIFLSANVNWADFVEKEAAVEQRRDLLGNRLVMIVARDAPTTLAKPEDLLSSQVEHLALADPDAVPAGKYARQALVSLNLWDGLKDRIAPARDVRDAVVYVETGAAEAAIVYATDAAASRKVKVAVEIPDGLTEPVVYPIMLLNRPGQSAAARAFFDYLAGPEAARAFQQHGFAVLTGPAAAAPP